MAKPSKDLGSAVAAIEQTRRSMAETAKDAALTAASAADLVDALKESVRDGAILDPVELRQAQDVSEHAQLRATAAERAATKAVADARLAACETLGARVEQAAAEGDAELLAAFAAVQGALDDLGRKAQARNERVRELISVGHQLEVPSVDATGVDREPVAGLLGPRTTAFGVATIGTASATLRQVDPKSAIAAAVARASHRFGWGVEVRGGDPIQTYADDRLPSYFVDGR